MPDTIQRTRQHVQHIFAEMVDDDTPLSETALIRDGFYCGHRFSNCHLSAVWFFEEDEIKIYDAERKLLRVESTGGDELRRAA